jgi:hypothetical protein
MPIATHMLYHDGAVAAVQVAQPAPSNPLVRFHMDVRHADPSPTGNLVALLNGRVLRPGGSPATVPECEIYPFDMKRGVFVVVHELAIGDVLILQDWTRLTEEAASVAMVKIAEVGGLR